MFYAKCDGKILVCLLQWMAWSSWHLEKISYCKEAFLDLSRWTSSPATILTKRFLLFQSMFAIYILKGTARHLCVRALWQRRRHLFLGFFPDVTSGKTHCYPPSVPLVPLSLSLRCQTGVHARWASVYSTNNPWQRDPYEFPTYAKSTSIRGWIWNCSLWCH